jgi:hypothetical protein
MRENSGTWVCSHPRPLRSWLLPVPVVAFAFAFAAVGPHFAAVRRAGATSPTITDEQRNDDLRLLTLEYVPLPLSASPFMSHRAVCAMNRWSSVRGERLVPLSHLHHTLTRGCPGEPP